MLSLTCDAAEEPQCGSVTAVLVDHSAGGCLRYWDRQSDGPMELPPAGLHRDDGRDGHPVAQQFHHQFRLNRLSLFFCYTNFSAGVKKQKIRVTHNTLLAHHHLFCFLFVRHLFYFIFLTACDCVNYVFIVYVLKSLDKGRDRNFCFGCCCCLFKIPTDWADVSISLCLDTFLH